MNTLLQVRTNVFYAKKPKDKPTDKDEFFRINEIVLLVDRASYTHTNSGEIVRERAVEELRFTVTEKGIDYLIETLKEYKTVDESKLK